MGTVQPLLEITDTIDSVKIMDNLATTPALINAMNYRLAFGSWAPKVARINPSPFGLPYLSVMEEMTIDIKGATPDICYAKLQTLNTLLERGARWFNNEIVLPVFVRFQPLGSVKTTYMVDVVYGGMADDNNASMVTLPDDFNITGFVSYLKGVRLRFWRRNGIWLCESETLSATNVAQPGPITVTWSDFATVLSPVDITLGANSAGAGASSNLTTSGITAITHDNRYLLPVAGTTELAGFGTATADATKFPTNANVYRFTVNPTNAGAYSVATLPTTEVEYFAAYVKIRNNSTTIDAFVSGQTATLLQQEVKLPANPSGNPLVVFLGIFPTRGRAMPLISVAFGSNFAVNMRSGGASLTIDIDELLFVGINRSTNIIATAGLTHLVISASNGIYMLNRLLDEPQGEIALGNVPNDVLQGYTGSPYNFTGSHATIKKTSLVHFQIDAASWNVLNNARTAKINLDMNVTRRKAYLVPE